ncbi:MAG: hypothetical protein M1829_001133 [Trizodia sp. TS-e1964]|nr:MAG: hypothetical protein M1829_001133 [Trizodia sp. TS-e1964]
MSTPPNCSLYDIDSHEASLEGFNGVSEYAFQILGSQEMLTMHAHARNTSIPQIRHRMNMLLANIRPPPKRDGNYKEEEEEEEEKENDLMEEDGEQEAVEEEDEFNFNFEEGEAYVPGEEVDEERDLPAAEAETEDMRAAR